MSASSETGSVEKSQVNPTRLEKPAFLMNIPFSLAGSEANNAWMEELSEGEREVEVSTAVSQFLQLYHFIASEAAVYILPTPENHGYQDLPYTANLGVVLEHIIDPPTVVISNFKTAVRRPEAQVGKEFFGMMGYRVANAPYFFEGEAELKHLYDNVYLGGYGVRSVREVYDWMGDLFRMRIIPLEETSRYLYHLDCTVFPLTREDTVVCTGMFSQSEVKAIEEVTNIVDIDEEDAYSGICNSLRLGNSILNASNIFQMKTSDEDYRSELKKNRRLEDIAVDHGFELSFFNLSEFLKSGALLSCLMMHLNRRSYAIPLL